MRSVRVDQPETAAAVITATASLYAESNKAAALSQA